MQKTLLSVLSVFIKKMKKKKDYDIDFLRLILAILPSHKASFWLFCPKVHSYFPPFACHVTRLNLVHKQWSLDCSLTIPFHTTEVLYMTDGHRVRIIPKHMIFDHNSG